ncbi:MAG: hypothetical protein Q8Q20_05225 [bacterium]|nr:hypothetical protein [bacterium]
MKPFYTLLALVALSFALAPIALADQPDVMVSYGDYFLIPLSEVGPSINPAGDLIGLVNETDYDRQYALFACVGLSQNGEKKASRVFKDLLQSKTPKETATFAELGSNQFRDTRDDAIRWCIYQQGLLPNNDPTGQMWGARLHLLRCGWLRWEDTAPGIHFYDANNMANGWRQYVKSLGEAGAKALCQELYSQLSRGDLYVYFENCRS